MADESAAKAEQTPAEEDTVSADAEANEPLPCLAHKPTTLPEDFNMAVPDEVESKQEEPEEAQVDESSALEDSREVIPPHA